MPGSDRPDSAVRVTRCFAVPDGGTYLVFAPEEGLLFRTNAAAARRMAALPPVEQSMWVDGGDDGFAPRNMTLSVSSICAQRCVYCYGAPAHHCPETISEDFCRAGCEFVARCSAARGKLMMVNFHGMGEPTIPWPRFAACVGIADAAAADSGAAIQKSIFTGGQLSADQAAFLGEHFELIHVSLDGPADIQRRQRPRADGADSFAPAVRTARIAREAGRDVTINVTVTDATVPRMPEITRFVADEIGGGVTVEFQDVLSVPWIGDAARVPSSAEAFVAGFAESVDAGAALGVRVLHADISVASLMLPGLAEGSHMCLTPYDNVVAFYDLPNEGAARPTAGEYGTFDRRSGELRLDHARRRALDNQLRDTPCRQCICGRACGGRAWVKGRLGPDEPSRETSCRIRRAVAEEFLRRAARRAPELAQHGQNTIESIPNQAAAPAAGDATHVAGH